MNRDVYTRRCFEIPACGTAMVAPRTKELQAMYREGEEAVYFDSKEELLAKVRWLLEDDEARNRIAKAGRERCLQDGHSNVIRAPRSLRRWRAGAAVEMRMCWPEIGGRRSTSKPWRQASARAAGQRLRKVGSRYTIGAPSIRVCVKRRTPEGRDQPAASVRASFAAARRAGARQPAALGPFFPLSGAGRWSAPTGAGASATPGDRRLLPRRS